MHYSGILLALTWFSVQADAGYKNVEGDGSYEVSYGSPVATIDLVTGHDFANSWGSSASASYSPPSQSFNKVRLELSVTTTGNNYDRLGFVIINGAEVWRTSTSEPSNDNSFWNYTKDITQYVSLLQQSGNVQVGINNVVNGDLNGRFEVTLRALFYNTPASPKEDDYWALDGVVPPAHVQPLPNPDGLYWTFPGAPVEGTVNLKNTVQRALVHIFASGSGQEEFWWTNTINQGNTVGASRFVDVYIDGQLAGFATPFPVIFTGGIDPRLWKPITGLRTYDIPAYYVDITPFLPVLWGKAAKISFKVVNGYDDTAVGGDWILNANVLTWEGSAATGGNTYTKYSPGVSSKPAPGSSPQVLTLERHFTATSQITIGGTNYPVTWSQNVTFTNHNSQSGDITNIYQSVDGQDSLAGPQSVTRHFYYPLTAQLGKTYNRVQQTFQSWAGESSVNSWVDTETVYNSDGSFSRSNSKSFLTEGGQTHNANSYNGQLQNAS